MILSICGRENNEYSFSIWNTVSQQSYDDAGVDHTTFTNASISFKKVNDLDANATTVAITDEDLAYLFENGGLEMEFQDFGVATIYGYTYFPDWMYTITVTYTYDGTEYTTSATIGFRAIINRAVTQQMLRSNWKKELACNCGCESYSATLRKFNYLMMMDWAASLCLINEWIYNLEALYKLAGMTHEFE